MSWGGALSGIVVVGISDPVTIALIALATGAIPSLNILITWWTGSHTKKASSEAKDSAHSASRKLDKLQITVNGRLDGLMRENMNLRKALQIAYDANEQLRAQLADHSGGQH